MRRLLPDILLAVMAVIQAQYKAAKQPTANQPLSTSQLYPQDDGGRTKVVTLQFSKRTL